MPGRRSRSTAASIPADWPDISNYRAERNAFYRSLDARIPAAAPVPARPAPRLAPGQWYLDIPEDTRLQPLLLREGEPPPVSNISVYFGVNREPTPETPQFDRSTTTAPLTPRTVGNAIRELNRGEEMRRMLDGLLYGSYSPTYRVSTVNPQAGTVTVTECIETPRIEDPSPCVYDPTLEFDDR